MTLKDVQRRHEDRLTLLHTIVRRSYETPADALQHDADGRFVKLASRLINDLESERTKDLKTNQISAQEAEAALRGPKTASEMRNPSYRSIMEDAIRCGAAMPKTTPTPITSLEELDNLCQQIREQFIKEHP
jgi:hypothetical protein